MDCLFCKMIEGEIPTDVVYEDDRIFVFHDINPQAPVHVLAIPKKHISKISELKEEDADLMGYLITKIPYLIEKLNLKGKGVRVVNNCESDAGQSVFHVHFHIMGGRAFSWPPG